MTKFFAAMTKRHWVIAAILGLLFVLLIAAVSVSNQELLRILLALVLASALVLLVIYFFIVTAELARLEEMVEAHAALIAESRIEIAVLRKKVFAHMASCLTQQLDRGMDIEQGLNMLLTQSQPKPQEG